MRHRVAALMIADNTSALDDGLPEDARQKLIALHRQVYDLAKVYDAAHPRAKRRKGD